MLPLCSPNLMPAPSHGCCHMISPAFSRCYPMIWHRVRSRCPLLRTPAPGTVLTWIVSSDTGKSDAHLVVQHFCKYSCRPSWCAFFRCCWSTLVLVLLCFLLFLAVLHHFEPHCLFAYIEAPDQGTCACTAGEHATSTALAASLTA